MSGMLSCKDCADFLDDYLSGTLDPEAAATFKVHLEKCPPCRDFLESYKDTIRIGKVCCCCGESKAVPEQLKNAILDAMKKK